MEGGKSGVMRQVEYTFLGYHEFSGAMDIMHAVTGFVCLHD